MSGADAMWRRLRVGYLLLAWACMSGIVPWLLLKRVTRVLRLEEGDAIQRGWGRIDLIRGGPGDAGAVGDLGAVVGNGFALADREK